jgi:hypothetical protein
MNQRVPTRFEGLIGGAVAGIILTFMMRSIFDLDIPLLPLGQLLGHLIPGILIGSILGTCFPRVFACFTFFLPTN